MAGCIARTVPHAGESVESTDRRRPHRLGQVLPRVLRGAIELDFEMQVATGREAGGAIFGRRGIGHVLQLRLFVLSTAIPKGPSNRALLPVPSALPDTVGVPANTHRRRRWWGRSGASTRRAISRSCTCRLAGGPSPLRGRRPRDPATRGYLGKFLTGGWYECRGADAGSALAAPRQIRR